MGHYEDIPILNSKLTPEMLFLLQRIYCKYHGIEGSHLIQSTRNRNLNYQVDPLFKFLTTDDVKLGIISDTKEASLIFFEQIRHMIAPKGDGFTINMTEALVLFKEVWEAPLEELPKLMDKSSFTILNYNRITDYTYYQSKAINMKRSPEKPYILAPICEPLIYWRLELGI